MIKISSLTPLLIDDEHSQRIVFVDIVEKKVYNNECNLLTGEIVDTIFQTIHRLRSMPESVEQRMAMLRQTVDSQRNNTREKKENARKHQVRSRDNEGSKDEKIHQTIDETDGDTMDQRSEMG